MELRNSSSSDEATTTTPVPSEGRFCFYNELRNNIKSMLVAKRKGDPVCTIVMNFDKVYFKGLIRRSVKTNGRRNRDVYQLSSLSKLDDILGERWYVRGLNANGDFCYVQPKAVKYYFKNAK